MDKIARLDEVIAESGTLVIIYHGGSAPGAARGIAPIEISGRMLVARCLETNKRKLFNLAKIEIAGGNPITPYSEVIAVAKRLEAKSFEELKAELIPKLKAQGWHVVEGDDHLSVRRFFKNGKPRKGDAAAIQYTPKKMSWEWDDVAGDMVHVELDVARPWSVSGDLQGSSYVILAHAFRAFMTMCDRMPVSLG